MGKCKYCNARAINKKIKDIDNDNEDFCKVINSKTMGSLLLVELAGEDEDGYKPGDYFPINYCPMCGRKLGE